jgi:excisionase family DNA binding protein
MNGSSEDGYISKSQLAARMQVSVRTVESWMQQQKVPFKRIGRTIRFDWSDVRDHLSRQSGVASQTRNHLRPAEGIKDRLKELAASIRQRERLNSRGTD